MTPAARYAAAIDVLDAINAGAAAERSLTNWARKNRYAGSKDRAAVRDHVFDVLRRRRSCAAFGGGETGRALVLGLLRINEIEETKVFSGEGYAPAPLTDLEKTPGSPQLSLAERANLPDWLWEKWQRALGKDAVAAADSQQIRAPVSLRVNRQKTTLEHAIAALAADDVGVVRHSEVATCLVVTENPRRVAQSSAYQNGLVDLQDAASQAAVLAWPIYEGARVLDYCAGGGGKSLAISAEWAVRLVATDIDENRMSDLPLRAARAGSQIEVCAQSDLGSETPFEIIVCDAPCSGSGTWRRTPDAKWRLTPQSLEDFSTLQLSVLQDAAQFSSAKGTLIYATCSVFPEENSDVVARFTRENPEWTSVTQNQRIPSPEFDGFYFNVLKK